MVKLNIPYTWMVWDLELFDWSVAFCHPFETYAQVKLDHFPKDGGENNKSFKPPPSSDVWKKKTCPFKNMVSLFQWTFV